jgi:hypothetical protein
MKNKKAIMYEFLVRLVIALIFLFGGIFVIKSFFSFSSAAEDSFYKLVNLIDSVEEGKTEVMALLMDKGTAIALFNANEQELEFRIAPTARDEEFPDIDIHRDMGNWNRYYVKKPKEECSKTQDCACLFKKIKFERRGGGDAPYDASYSKYICKDIDAKILPLYKQGYERNTIDESKNGAIFIRDLKAPDGGLISQPRAKTIYAIKYKGHVAVCGKSPCIPEELINQKISIEEFEKNNFLFVEEWIIGVDITKDKKADEFYLIEDLKKDFLNNYFYIYKESKKTNGAIKFTDTTKKSDKEAFELKFINYAKQGNLVEIDYNNQGKDINNFKAETRLDEQGKFINTGGTGGTW